MRLQLRTILIFSLTLGLILFAFSYTKNVVKSETAEIKSQQKYPKTIAMLDSLIQREMADKELPGVSIALVDNQQIVWQHGFGFSNPQTKTPITADTVFRVGSVSKLFTDIAVMQLVEQKKLNLDAPISNYLPDFKPKNPFKKNDYASSIDVASRRVSSRAADWELF